MTVLGWQEKATLLAEYFDRYGPFRFVVETGIYNGQGSCFQFEDRAEVVAVEADDESAAKARAAGHDVRTGDSAVLLPALLASRDAPVLFWLDAHPTTDDDTSTTPLLAELDAILHWPHAAQSVVLVDDVRLMGREGWPHLNYIIARIPVSARPLWHLHNQDDIFRLTPW